MSRKALDQRVVDSPSVAFSGPSEPLSIDVAYDRTRLTQDDIATATATIRNNMDKTANMVMVDLGIPPGFDLLSEDLQDFQEKSAGRKSGHLSKFSLTATQAILYFDSFAPGGKTTHLAALSGGKAAITATDLSEARVAMLRETIARLHAPGIETGVHDWSASTLPGSEGRFDKALVDAPCTGMGIIRRNPDAKWRFKPEDPARMALLQLAILRNVWPTLKPGGLLLYCTCSPLREEDEQVVERFADDTGATRIGRGLILARGWVGPQDAVAEDGTVRLYPHRHGTDGFFAALLRKDR